MKNQNTPCLEPSRVSWESLESHVRLEAQKWVQRLLEEEVTDLLGRLKSQRRSTVDARSATATVMASRASSR